MKVNLRDMIPVERWERGLWWGQGLTVVHGCSPCSPGCLNCWSARDTHRRANHPNAKISAANAGLTTDAGVFNGVIRLDREALLRPMRRRKSTVYAVWNDLFHPNVPDEFVDAAFAMFALCPRHIFCVLTKRPDRMEKYLAQGEDPCGGIGTLYWRDRLGEAAYQLTASANAECAAANAVTGVLAPGHNVGWPMRNVIGMATCCNQDEADRNIPAILRANLAVRGVSLEPLLGAIGLRHIPVGFSHQGEYLDSLSGVEYLGDAAFSTPRLDWVIVGGENGAGARPMQAEWVRALRDQAGDRLFFKGWGEYAPCPVSCGGKPNPRCKEVSEMVGSTMCRAGSRRSGRTLDGRTWDNMPEMELG